MIELLSMWAALSFAIAFHFLLGIPVVAGIEVLSEGTIDKWDETMLILTWPLLVPVLVYLMLRELVRKLRRDFGRKTR